MKASRDVESLGRPRLIIGLGTGRSGTVSLSRLLQAQPGANITHELEPLLSWEGDFAQLALRLAALRAHEARSIVGDVSFFNLNYVDAIAEIDPDARFLCMRRDVDAVVESFFRKVRGGFGETGNHWSLDRAGFVENGYDHCFPKFPTRDLREGIRRYWELYQVRTQELVVRHPGRFRVVDIDELNHESQIHRILDFVGIAESARVIVRQHENRNL